MFGKDAVFADVASTCACCGGIHGPAVLRIVSLGACAYCLRIVALILQFNR